MIKQRGAMGAADADPATVAFLDLFAKHGPSRAETAAKAPTVLN